MRILRNTPEGREQRSGERARGDRLLRVKQLQGPPVPLKNRTQADMGNKRQSRPTSSNTVHLGIRKAYAVGRVFRDRLRWPVLLPAFGLASVSATTSASA